MRLTSGALPALLLALSSSVAAVFVPPPVFKNTNLVHVLSLEKSFAKETINVAIENIDSNPQDEYYLPFPTAQAAHIGGFEVKDRKDAALGPFTVQAVAAEPESDVQYYRITLPKPLAAGAQQTIGITYYVLDSLRPLPVTIAQDEKQYLVYSFSAYAPSSYVTVKQKTEVKFSSADVPDYTKVTAADGTEQTEKKGSKLTYGPFTELPAGAALPVDVRFEFTKPVNYVARLERDVEVSHWGGNVAFEERYTLLNRGANLSTLFNRVKYAQSQFYSPASSALKEMKFPLRPGSVDAYYTDVIGNISTSKFRSNKREALLEIKPRYPVYGGWKFPFTIGWNADAQTFLRRLTSGSYLLNVPFLEGPKQVEGVGYEEVQFRIILPEGAENVKFYTAIPASSIDKAEVTLHKTFLDTVGRTAVVIEAHNLADDFRDREVVVSYDYSLVSSLRKPVVVFSSALAVFVAVWLVGTVDLRFSK